MASQPDREVLYRSIVCDLRSAGILLNFPDLPDGTFESLEETADIASVRALSLAKSICKKFVDNSMAQNADDVALRKFRAINSACSQWVFPIEDNVVNDISHFELLGEFRRCLGRFFTSHYSFGDPSMDGVFDDHSLLDIPKIAYYANNGPGASLEASGCSWIEKFGTSPVTYSRDFLWELYRSTTALSPLRHDAESHRDATFGHVVKCYSKLLFVPKTVTESRTICVEPSLNMWFQKGIQFLLESQLKCHWGLDLAVQQSINRNMARLGSINGSFGTIDLTSASDSISLKMLNWALPRSVLNVLNLFRTPNAKIASNDEEVELHMVSTMGNAFTFPLQTAIFAAAVEAVYNCLRIPLKKYRKIRRDFSLSSSGLRGETLFSVPNFAVNGDDIIVVSEAYDVLMVLLSLLGFMPNMTKSFNEGLFRESCGADFWSGHQVRGVYCKTLHTVQDVFSLINRLNRWTAMSGIPLPQTVGFLRKRCRKIYYVPPSESDAAGIQVPMDIARPGVLKQSKSRVDLPFYGTGHHTYEAFRFKPNSLPVGGKGWVFSNEITVLSCLKGEIVSGSLVRREDVGIFEIRRLSTHCWALSQVGLPLDERYMRSWSDACRANLFG